MGARALQLFDPGQMAAPTIRAGVEARLASLSLRVQIGTLDRDNFTNIERHLRRFADAWHVALPGRAPVLVPMFESSRRKPIATCAKSAEEALAIAAKLEGSPPSAGEPRVARNGDRALSSCSSDDLMRWLLANPQWQSGHTKKNNLVAIVDCFHWYEEETGAKSPFRRSRLPEFVCPPRREAYDREYIALMRHTSSRQLRRALWCLANGKGIRTIEMRDMLWTDFDWEGGFALTYKHKTARKTKKPRVLILTPRLFRFFSNMHRQRGPFTDHVFVNTEGRPWTRRSFALHLRRTAKRIGLDDGSTGLVSAYCFRHAFATQADEAGMTRDDIGLLMGTTLVREVYSKASSKVRHLRAKAEEAERLTRQARRKQATPKHKPPPEIQGELF